MGTLLGSDVHCCQCKYSPSSLMTMPAIKLFPEKTWHCTICEEHGVWWKHKGQASKPQLQKKLLKLRKTCYQGVIYGHFCLYCRSPWSTLLHSLLHITVTEVHHEKQPQPSGWNTSCLGKKNRKLRGSKTKTTNQSWEAVVELKIII